jgi:3-dehydroquinate synthase
MRTVELNLDRGRRCPIHVGHGILDQFGSHCRQLELGRKVAVIADDAVAETHLPPVVESLRQAGFEVVEVPFSGGDGAKNLSTAEDIFGQLISAELDRGSWIAAVGGGVVGDLGGFVAATFLRGIHVVQVPTTIAAQVDASIGGKTGVNHARGKNTIGAFHQPRMVFTDTATLRTLPQRERVAGMAEVVKHGLIVDVELFQFVEAHVEEIISMEIGAEDLDWLIARNVEVKTAVVAADETEGGQRAILNYGHTIGHAIEAAAGYVTYRHGEAVILGMVAAGEIARSTGRWSAEDRDRQDRLLRRLGIPAGVSELPADRIVEYTKADKKRLDGQLRFVLAKGIGAVEIVDTIGEADVRAAISYIQDTC